MLFLCYITETIETGKKMHAKTREKLDRMRSELQSGRYGADFLHSERQLQKELGVGRGAVRAILQVLEEEKRVYKSPGKGMRINTAFYRNEKFRRFLTVVPARGISSNEIMALLAGVAGEAAKKGADMVLLFNQNCSELDPYLEEQIAQGLADGVIFVENFSRKALELAAKREIPSIVLNHEMGSAPSFVKVDYLHVGRLCGKYLLEKGHKNIGFIGGTEEKRFIYREMLSGIRETLKESGLSLNEAFVLKMDSQSAGAEEQLLCLFSNTPREKLPTAFIAGRDFRARLLYQVCERLRLRIPEDISIISYDNLSWDEASSKGLTTIIQPAKEEGRRAFEMLFEARLAGKQPGTLTLEGTLAERKSVRDLKK